MDNPTFRELCTSLARYRVVSAEELRRAGADPDVIARGRHNGILQVVPGVTGVYLVGSGPPDDGTLMHVADRLAGDDALITGVWAARWLALPWIPEGGSCHVRVAAGRKRRGAEGFVTISRSTSLERFEAWEHEGLRIARAPLAVVDAARQIQVDPALRRSDVGLQLRHVRGVVLGAVAKGRVTVQELDQAMSLGSSRHTALIRRALVDASRAAASPPEAELLDGLLPYGIPVLSNVEVYLHGRLLGVSDAFLVGTGVGGELDSVQEHAAGDRLDRTLVRHEGFRDADLELRHITPSRYRADPEAFHRTLITAARRRLAAGYTDPPGLTLRPRGPLLYVPTADPPYRVPLEALHRHGLVTRAENA